MDGLATPEFPVRLAVLSATGRNPQGARAYGIHQGRDVVDTLIKQASYASPLR